MDRTATQASFRPGPPPDGFVGNLYRAHAVTLIRIALMLLGDQPSAEDVVQDAFLGRRSHHYGRRERRGWL